MRRPSWITKATLLITGSAKDPARVFKRLREDDPVCWIPHFEAWVISRHEDVQAILSDARLTTDPRAYERHVPSKIEGSERWLHAMPFRSSRSDPQSVPRRLAMGVLTPRAVERTELRIREVVERFAAPLRGRNGVVDLMSEFSTPVSATAIGRILGVPAKDADEERFGRLAKSATRGIRPLLSEEKRNKSESAAVEMSEYVLQLVEERRHSPADDMISDLLQASGASTSDEIDDVVRIVSALVSAGTGTTGVACARALRTLLLHPHELELLRGDRSRIAGAVDELLRYDSGLALVPRYVLEDIGLRGTIMKKGQLVVLSLFAANRDPAVFEDPDRLDLGRDCRQALSFGHGPHYCTGTSVARIQLRVMLESALDLLPPNARLLEDQIRWSARGLMGQIKTLPVDFGG
jgi:cytochrome P450